MRFQATAAGLDTKRMALQAGALHSVLDEGTAELMKITDMPNMSTRKFHHKHRAASPWFLGGRRTQMDEGCRGSSRERGYPSTPVEEAL